MELTFFLVFLIIMIDLNSILRATKKFNSHISNSTFKPHVITTIQNQCLYLATALNTLHLDIVVCKTGHWGNGNTYCFKKGSVLKGSGHKTMAYQHGEKRKEGRWKPTPTHFFSTFSTATPQHLKNELFKLYPLFFLTFIVFYSYFYLI